jgi:hypothetical protein
VRQRYRYHIDSVSVGCDSNGNPSFTFDGDCNSHYDRYALRLTDIDREADDTNASTGHTNPD